MHSRTIAASVTAALLFSGFVSVVAARTPETSTATVTGDALVLAAKLDALEAAVGAMRERVATLETELTLARASRRMAEQTVTAPFTVVNGAGTPILTVSDRAFSDAAGKGRVHIGRGRSDNYGMWFFTSGGSLAAQIGESKAGTGVVVINRGPVELASLSDEGFIYGAAAGKQIVHLGPDPQNKARARLTVRGLIQITDENDRTMVDAGTLPEGRGAVRTWPNQECKAYAGLRSPNCLMGTLP